MKKEYDFSKGERGKFYSAEAGFSLPVYLDPEISDFVDRLASERNSERSTIVNLLLRKDKEILEIGA